MNSINRIFLILESPNGRYYGFRYIRCADGAMCEGQVSGGESNIRYAFTYDGKDFVRDYFYTTKRTHEREIFALPVAPSHPDELRAWVAEQLAKVAPTPCQHNTMVRTNGTEHAWKCALCGYVYGKEAQS